MGRSTLSLNAPESNEIILVSISIINEHNVQMQMRLPQSNSGGAHAHQLQIREKLRVWSEKSRSEFPPLHLVKCKF